MRFSSTMMPALALALAVLAGPAAAQGQAPSRIGDRLVGTKWQAQTLQGEPVANPAGATLDFLPGDQVQGRAGCGRFEGPFATRMDRIVIGPLRTSSDPCGPQEVLQQLQFTGVLKRAERAVLQNDALLLYSAGKPEPSRFVPRPD